MVNNESVPRVHHKNIEPMDSKVVRAGNNNHKIIANMDFHTGKADEKMNSKEHVKEMEKKKKKNEAQGTSQKTQM